MPRDRSRRRESRAGPSIQSTQLLGSSTEGAPDLSEPRSEREGIRSVSPRASAPSRQFVAMMRLSAKFSTDHRRGAETKFGPSACLRARERRADMLLMSFLVVSLATAIGLSIAAMTMQK